MAREGFLRNMKFLPDISKIISFLKEVLLEMKKVNWLTRNEVVRYTVIVIVFSMAVSIYLGALDFVFQFILSKI